MPPSFPQDRLIRKEVALGAIREYQLPQDHIFLREFAPFKDVESDDVIFDYLLGLTDGLAPARAEDSEAEMAMKDDSMGEGRASIIDWSLKDHYSASDVSRYTDVQYLQGRVDDPLPRSVLSIKDGFEATVARDTLLRRRKLDNRIEWLGMQALCNNQIAYNDGKIIFTVNYDRPAGQTNASVTPWDDDAATPIEDILGVQDLMYDTYGVNITRAMMSRKAFRKAMNSSRFQNSIVGSNPLYTVQGWTPETAMKIIAEVTGVEFFLYDSVYRTRALGSNTVNNHRFWPAEKILFLPSQADVDAIDDMIGFGKTLTSPHPEGNWTSGYYEWEQSTKDPWGQDIGTGIKAFPILPHLDLTYVLKVLT